MVINKRRYGACGGVAACCHTTAFSITTFVNDHFINVTLARLKCKLPDDDRRPKHVGAVLV